MADYGLVLPEHDLTPQDFKELARRLGRAAFVPLFLKFYERIVTGEATIEEQRKALADIGRWTGVEEDRKIDPNANLPVFNIIFGAAGAANSASIEAIDITPAPAAPLPEMPTLSDEELGVFGDLATNTAFRNLAHHMLSPPEPSDAQLQASPPASPAHADAAASQPAERSADSPDQPAGSGAPDTGHVPHVPERGLRTRRARAARPEAVLSAVPDPTPAHSPPVREAGEVLARSHDTLEDALRTLDSALDGF